MGITATSVVGGFTDPFGDEDPNPLNAVYEYTYFEDKITVNLDGDEGPYTSIVNITTTLLIDGEPVTQDNITGNGEVELNITYSEPTTPNLYSQVTVVTSYTGSEGNVYISGNILNAFPDKYWEYKDFRTEETGIVVDSTEEIPDDDVALYLYKPSFMRYVELTYNVEVEYTEGNVTYTPLKRVINDWDINRLAMLQQVDREEAYRSNNYPRGQ